MSEFALAARADTMTLLYELALREAFADDWQEAHERVRRWAIRLEQPAANAVHAIERIRQTGASTMASIELSVDDDNRCGGEALYRYLLLALVVTAVPPGLPDVRP